MIFFFGILITCFRPAAFLSEQLPPLNFLQIYVRATKALMPWALTSSSRAFLCFISASSLLHLDFKSSTIRNRSWDRKDQIIFRTVNLALPALQSSTCPLATISHEPFSLGLAALSNFPPREFLGAFEAANRYLIFGSELAFDSTSSDVFLWTSNSSHFRFKPAICLSLSCPLVNSRPSERIRYSDWDFDSRLGFPQTFDLLGRRNVFRFKLIEKLGIGFVNSKYDYVSIAKRIAEFYQDSDELADQNLSSIGWCWAILLSFT